MTQVLSLSVGIAQDSQPMGSVEVYDFGSFPDRAYLFEIGYGSEVETYVPGESPGANFGDFESINELIQLFESGVEDGRIYNDFEDDGYRLSSVEKALIALMAYHPNQKRETIIVDTNSMFAARWHAGDMAELKYLYNYRPLNLEPGSDYTQYNVVGQPTVSESFYSFSSNPDYGSYGVEDWLLEYGDFQSIFRISIAGTTTDYEPNELDFVLALFEEFLANKDDFPWSSGPQVLSLSLYIGVGISPTTGDIYYPSSRESNELFSIASFVSRPERQKHALWEAAWPLEQAEGFSLAIKDAVGGSDAEKAFGGAESSQYFAQFGISYVLEEAPGYGWKQLPWFGLFWTGGEVVSYIRRPEESIIFGNEEATEAVQTAFGPGWLHHYIYGWMYAEGENPEDIWFYLPSKNEWVHSSRKVWPYAWSESDQEWIYFNAFESWIYRFGSDSWEQLQDG